MTPVATLIWIINVLCDTVGQLAFKKSAQGSSESDDWRAHWRKLVKSKWLWVGIAAYAGEVLTWVAFLMLVPLSVGVLLASVNILAVMVGGRFFFKEKITAARFTAIALISIGVALVGWA